MYGKSVLISRLVCVRYKSSSSKKLLEFLAAMPKANSTRIAEAQRQRQQIAKKSAKYGPSTVYLQVLGSGARGAPNTIYLFTDQKRYLFNCGECTQRLAHEHKVKLSRLEHIFITGKTWRHIGGLPGLSLTLQDVGVPKLQLHGPEGLDELYNATKRFVIMKDMKVTMAKTSPLEDYEDSVMQVRYVILSPEVKILENTPAKRPKTAEAHDKRLDAFIHDDTDYYKDEPNQNKKQKFDDKKRTSPSKNITNCGVLKRREEKLLSELLQTQSNSTVAYICTLKKRLGTLSLEACVEKGVPPGPLLGQLKKGIDVVLPDGTLVLSRDVKSPDELGPVFIVLDVPDMSYLKASEFAAHFDRPDNPPENIPALVVHITPPHVFQDPAYEAFIQKFGPKTRHLVLNEKNSCLGSEAVHRTQHKLHLLDPDIFPLLKDASVPAVWNAQPTLKKTSSPIRLKGLEELKNKIALAQFQNIMNMEGSSSYKGDITSVASADAEERSEPIKGRTLTIFHLRPKKQLDRSVEPKLHIQEYIKETMDADGFVSSLEHYRRLVDNIRYERPAKTEEYPKVIFLGTGSCIPSKTRNTSAIVLQITEDRSMLLDCGEGTFLQLVRFFGPKRVNSFLRTLKCIYISHLHADHHIGLIGVLQARREALEETNDTKEPVYLLAPGQIMTWLTMYDQQFERIRPDFTLVPNQTVLLEPPANIASNFGELTSAMLAAMGVDKIETCWVTHCPNAFGVAVFIGDHKLTYSGDTLPCESLVKLGQNSTLLIHEATMEDELAEEARMKMHSTTTQAIEVGKQMNAQFTVLTHFSQRYARLPRLNQHILTDNNSVGIAFDNMQITMRDLELLPLMYAPLQLMFAEHCVEMELKAAQRHRNRNRLSDKTPYKDTKSSRLRFGGAKKQRSKSEPRSTTTVRPNHAGDAKERPKSETSPQSRDGSSVSATSLSNKRKKKGSSSSICPEDPENAHRIAQCQSGAHSDSGASDTTSKKNIKNTDNISRDTSNTSFSNPSSNPASAMGYGPPLVVPIHRRLSIRRDRIRSPVSLCNELPKQVNRKSAPVSKMDVKSCPAGGSRLIRARETSVSLPTPKAGNERKQMWNGSPSLRDSYVIKDDFEQKEQDSVSKKKVIDNKRPYSPARWANEGSPPKFSRYSVNSADKNSVDKYSHQMQEPNNRAQDVKPKLAHASFSSRLRPPTVREKETDKQKREVNTPSNDDHKLTIKRSPQNVNLFGFQKNAYQKTKSLPNSNSNPDISIKKTSVTQKRKEYSESLRENIKHSLSPSIKSNISPKQPKDLEKPVYGIRASQIQHVYRQEKLPTKYSPDARNKNSTNSNEDGKTSGKFGAVKPNEIKSLSSQSFTKQGDQSLKSQSRIRNNSKSQNREEADNNSEESSHYSEINSDISSTEIETNISEYCEPTNQVGSVPRSVCSRTKQSNQIRPTYSRTKQITNQTKQNPYQMKQNSNKAKQNFHQTKPNQNHVKQNSNQMKQTSNQRKETLREAVNNSVSIIGRSNYSYGARSCRSFKPQLEDIKSSFVLLNKKQKCNEPLPSKPKPLDESSRKKLLQESKQKFQSKHFWREARYERIEGLNWISWK